MSKVAFISAERRTALLRMAAHADRITETTEQRRKEFEYAYWLGYSAGYRIGHAHGENSKYEQWAWALGIIRKVNDQKGYAELQRLRTEVPNEPCSVPSCVGRCSRCVRAAAYGTHSGDYNGGTVMWTDEGCRNE